MIKCDLHNHSTASDGRNSPSEVVKIASNNGVQYLSLTDHDTVSGLEEAIHSSNKLNVKFIPGIELSTEYNNTSVHILGFFKDDEYKNKDFLKALSDLKEKRIKRAYEIVDRLKKFNNITLDINNVLQNGKDTIARPHIAKAIIDAGYPYDHEYIFDNIIGDHCPAYVPSSKMTTEEGINLLRKYNALVFLAHPLLIKKVNVNDVITLGFDGIEAIYYRNKPKDTKKFIKFAKKHNLLISCGSDCHGVPSDLKHGNIGDISIPEDIDILNEISWIKSIAK